MSKQRMHLALVCAMLALMASPAFAHGGQYRGPDGGGTPGYDGPAGGGGTGGPGTGGPAGGGGGMPGTGGDTGGGGTGPIGPVRPGGSGAGSSRGQTGRGGTTGRPRKAKGFTATNWDWWWDLNQERYLQLKRKVRSVEAASLHADDFIGDNIGGDAVADVLLSQIRGAVLPALKLAAKDTFYDTRAAALIAIGKVAQEDEVDAFELLVRGLADSDHRVRESACLGLGILGQARALEVLAKVATGDPRFARDQMGRAEIQARTRAFANVAIGLIGSRGGLAGHEHMVQELIRVAKTRVAQKDVPVSAAIALQLLPAEAGGPALLALARNPEVDSYVRAHVIVGLGKSDAIAAVPDLVQLLRGKDVHVARSSAIALGLLTDPTDRQTVNQLRRQAENGREIGLRHFAMIALGEIGAPEGRATLVRLLARGKQVSVRTFAALGLGVMGFRHQIERENSGELVMKAWRGSRNPLERGAYAIALGLLDHKEAAPTLREVLEQAGKPKLKGHVATALGLMEDREALPQIRELVSQLGDPDLRKAAAISLGMLRDREAVALLRRVIDESKASKAVLGAATVALGFIGDREAVELLSDTIENPLEHQDVTRAFAAVALGFLGDKDEVPMLSLVHENSNFLAQTGALAELLRIL